MPVNDLVPSISLENLVAQRDAVVERIRKAHDLMAEAVQVASASVCGTDMVYMLRLMGRDNREWDVDKMIKEVDGKAWIFLIEQSGMKSFMDAKAREDWNKAIDKGEAPVLTMANIEATFTALLGARGDMFERGVIALFRNLSWDYKTNSPRMLGKRIILRYCVESYGYVSHNGANSLDDLIRVMSVLDGKPEPDHRHGSYYTLKAAGWPKNGPATLHDMLSVRGFKNGNAHVTFLRTDLVDAMNKIIAKHHPNVLPPAET